VATPLELVRCGVVRTDRFRAGSACSAKRRADASAGAAQAVTVSRSAQVRYRCCEHTGSSSREASIVRLVESPTCNYVVDVCSALACTPLQRVEARADAALPAAPSAPEPPAPRQGPNALLAEARGSCLVLHKGWWSYELCIGGSARQFHADVHKESSGAVNTHEVASHVIGTYTPVVSWGPGAAEADADAMDPAARAAAAARETRVVLDPSRPLASRVVQLYRNGSECGLPDDWLSRGDAASAADAAAAAGTPGLLRRALDSVRWALPRWLRPDPLPRTASERRAAAARAAAAAAAVAPPRRSVEAHFVCPLSLDGSAHLPDEPVPTALPAATGDAPPPAPARPLSGMRLRLRSVEEVSVCHYRFVVEAPRLCEHPAFAPRAEGEPVAPGAARARAVCRRVGPGGEEEGDPVLPAWRAVA